MNRTTLLFLAIMAILIISPLFAIGRHTHVDRRRAICVFFCPTLAVFLLCILAGKTLHFQTFDILLLIFSLLLLHGIFPFDIWRTFEYHFFSRTGRTWRLPLLGLLPWALAPLPTLPRFVLAAMEGLVLLHSALFLVRLAKTTDLAKKIEFTFPILSGVLPLLFLTQSRLAFAASVATILTQCVLIWLTLLLGKMP